MKFLVISLIGFLSMPIFAHGDLDARIKKLSKQIEKDPKNAELYLKRGELYYQHEEYKKSIVDFEHALHLGINTDELTILRARSYYKANKHTISLEILDELLKNNGNHVEANRWKGRILDDQGNHKAATKAFEIAMQFSQKKIPEHYFELAEAYRGINTTESTHQACDVIKRGMNELGPLFVFMKKLVQYHSTLEEYDAAIEQQSAIINLSKRKEVPLFNRALLHIANQSNTSALEDLKAAQTAIDKLPRRINQSATVIKLSNEIAKLKSTLEF